MYVFISITNEGNFEGLKEVEILVHLVIYFSGIMNQIVHLRRMLSIYKT